MKINERGYWENNSEEGHGVDKGLAVGIAKFLLNEAMSNYDYYEAGISVLDVGCGNGYYTKFLNEHGIYCNGYDGNPHTAEITNGLCEVADFSKHQLLLTYNWVMSLEVAEHIPQEYESIFISNLHRHNTEGVIISWSIPEYGGDGHVNPRPNDYVINLFEASGKYSYDYKATQFLRGCPALYPTPCYWFSKTIMVFRKVKI